MKRKSRLRVQKQKKGRWVILYLLIFVVFAAGGYLLENHYGISSYIKENLHSKKTSLSSEEAVRGTFYDRNLKQLAVTLDRVSVYVRVREIDSIVETAIRLSEVFSLDQEKLENQLESGALRLWIAKDISQEQEASVKKLELSGVYFQREEKRYYPNESQAAHFLGNVENGIGLSGVEYYYDRLLAGRQVTQQEDRQSPGDSLDLVLTIDLKIQNILEDLAQEILDSEQAEKVMAYLLESSTGEILGGANLPGFNPNSFVRYSQEQTENMFLLPFCLPEKFRLFLRDATVLQAQNQSGDSSAWSLAPISADFGGQLRLWDWLELEESPKTDFYVPSQSKKTVTNMQQPVISMKNYFNFVPEAMSPLNLLKSFSVLLGDGKKIHPFVVKKIIDQNKGSEIQLSGGEETTNQMHRWSPWYKERTNGLFRSQAIRRESSSFFFRDEILVSDNKDQRQQFFINNVLFVTIPSGSNELHLLIVVKRAPQWVNKENSGKHELFEDIVEKKTERIAVLYQAAKIVADVVEPEISNADNYQIKIKEPVASSPLEQMKPEKSPGPDIMPDLRGFSLRKSLRSLQGINVELQIEGTGRVKDQKPQPGSSLKGVTKCVLILETQESVTPVQFLKEMPEKK